VRDSFKSHLLEDLRELASSLPEEDNGYFPALLQHYTQVAWKSLLRCCCSLAWFWCAGGCENSDSPAQAERSCSSMLLVQRIGQLVTRGSLAPLQSKDGSQHWHRKAPQGAALQGVKLLAFQKMILWDVIAAELELVQSEEWSEVVQQAEQ
jgi:hypothetical protein